MPSLSSLLGPLLVALGLAALLAVVIRSNLRSKTGPDAATASWDGPTVDEDGWPLEVSEPHARPVHTTAEDDVLVLGSTGLRPSAAPRPPGAVVLETSESTADVTLAGLVAELNALRHEVATLTDTLAEGRRGRRPRRPSLLAPRVEHRNAPDALDGPQQSPLALTVTAQGVAAEPDDLVSVRLDDLAEVLPDLQLDTQATPTTRIDAGDHDLPSPTSTGDRLEPGLTVAGSAWVVPSTIDLDTDGSTAPHLSAGSDLHMASDRPLASAVPGHGDPALVLPPLTLDVTTSTDSAHSVPSPTVDLSSEADVPASSSAAAEGWDALQLAPPLAGSWPAVPGSEPVLRLETPTTAADTSAAHPARPDLSIPLTATLDGLDHLAQFEPGARPESSSAPVTPSSVGMHEERAVETTAQRPVAPVATAGYSEMSRELAAQGRLRDAVLAQWAADLRVLAPLLGDRVPRLSRSLQGISSSDPATMLGSARAVAVMLADQSQLGEIIPALDDLDHLTRHLVLAADHGTSVPVRRPTVPQPELTALESVLVRSAEAGGDGGHVSVSLRWDLFTHLASGVDHRVVRALLRETLEPHERDAFDRELIAAAQ